jgi:hypothetical protein
MMTRPLLVWMTRRWPVYADAMIFSVCELLHSQDATVGSIMSWFAGDLHATFDLVV